MTERISIDWRAEAHRLRGLHPLRRIRGWEHRLAGLLFAHRKAPFAYGVHDCLLWVGTAIEAITGADFAGVFRHRYETSPGAALLLRRCGAELETMPDVLGFERVEVARAQRGDIGLAEGGETLLYGVIEGARIWVPGAEGVVPWPVERVHVAWAVGRYLSACAMRKEEVQSCR